MVDHKQTLAKIRDQVKLRIEESEVCIDIVDNGRGFPENLLDRITEPYVTTREKGTGLGLAIAKKIMEDHNGELLLRNNDAKIGLTGACATLIFRTDNAINLLSADEQIVPSKNTAYTADKETTPTMPSREVN